MVNKAVTYDTFDAFQLQVQVIRQVDDRSKHGISKFFVQSLQVFKVAVCLIACQRSDQIAERIGNGGQMFLRSSRVGAVFANPGLDLVRPLVMVFKVSIQTFRFLFHFCSFDRIRHYIALERTSLPLSWTFCSSIGSICKSAA